MSALAPHFRELQKQFQGREKEGVAPTNVPGVHFFRVTQHVPPTPLIYSAGIVIIGQGHKVGYLGDRQFRYDEATYLVVGVPIPFECETHATPEEPLLGIRIDIDIPGLHELVAKLPVDMRQEKDKVPPHGLEPSPMSEEILEATIRLLKCMRDPTDGRVLGAATVNEVIYRVLRSNQGRVLYSLTQHHTPYAAVARSLDRIHHDYRDALSVEELAQENGMGVSSFHRAFKRVTGDSPLQYLKKVRLDKARGLLVHQGLQVSAVAYEVGYESPSQFSREFKRHFKVPPSEAQTLAYS